MWLAVAPVEDFHNSALRGAVFIDRDVNYGVTASLTSGIRVPKCGVRYSHRRCPRSLPAGAECCEPLLQGLPFAQSSICRMHDFCTESFAKDQWVLNDRGLKIPSVPAADLRSLFGASSRVRSSGRHVQILGT